MILFVGMLIGFMAVTSVVASTFFLLLVIGFVDVAGGFAVSIRAAVARRDVLLSETARGRRRCVGAPALCSRVRLVDSRG
jgi:hypothetical protein